MVLAQVIWLLFLVAALFLAVGALLIALDANQDNDLVKFVLEGADRVDLGIFSGTTASSSSRATTPTPRTPCSTGDSAPPRGCSWAGSWTG